VSRLPVASVGLLLGALVALWACVAVVRPVSADLLGAGSSPGSFALVGFLALVVLVGARVGRGGRR